MKTTWAAALLGTLLSALLIAPTAARAQAAPVPPAPPAWHKFDGLALTPPMGWNSWNKFQCNVSEQLIRETADAMVATGMKDAGYQYINIDDCWHGERDARGFIQVDATRFPHGMKALADYIHAKGLKLGVYSDAGWKTCGGRPGSRGYEYQDALTYAEWGVDYLKYDWCETGGLNAEGAYQTMSAALRKAGRPIVFSLCEWGNQKPWLWGQKVGHLWRTTGDITACFDCVVNHGDWKAWGVVQILDMQDGLRQYAGPGHWNDPDMLEVGNGLTPNQDRAHFSLWAMLAAPLIAGNDLRSMPDAVKAVLTQREVIAVNQDALGVQGLRHAAKDGIETWVKPLSGGDWAVLVFNRNKEPRAITLDWAQLKLTDELSKRSLDAVGTRYQLRDLWAGKDLGPAGAAIQRELPAQDVLMLRLKAPR